MTTITREQAQKIIDVADKAITALAGSSVETGDRAMYKITAIVKKPGNSPTNWVRFSDKKMNKAECEKMLSGRTEAGKSREEKVTLEDFKCIKE